MDPGDRAREQEEARDTAQVTTCRDTRIPDTDADSDADSDTGSAAMDSGAASDAGSAMASDAASAVMDSGDTVSDRLPLPRRTTRRGVPGKYPIFGNRRIFSSRLSMTSGNGWMI